MSRRAFTYYEVLMAIILMGIAFAAIIWVFGESSSATRQVAQASDAIHLANSIHEFAMSKQILIGSTGSYTTTATDPASFTNLMNLDGWNSGTAGPIDSAGNRVSNMKGWVQTCRVQAFEASDPRVFVAPTDMNARKLSVTISYNGNPIYHASWILAPTLQH